MLNLSQNLQDDYELTVRIIYCADWPRGGGCGDNLIQTFDVLKVVRDWHLEYQRGPLVVVDRLVAKKVKLKSTNEVWITYNSCMVILINR